MGSGVGEKAKRRRRLLSGGTQPRRSQGRGWPGEGIPSEQAQVVLGTMAGLPDFEELGTAVARELQEAAAEWQPRAEVFEVRDLFVDGPSGEIPVRVYRPSRSESLPACLFFHGGGWMVGSVETHDGLCRELAKLSEAVVVSVDYRLAPENRFPAGLDDCFAVARWLPDNRARLGVSDRMAVVGDSAGASLAAGVALMARDEGGPLIQAQALLYPVLDPASRSKSFDDYDGMIVSRRSMRWYWDNYLANTEDELNPLAALCRASDLHGLPRTFVLTAECDPLRDEAEVFAHRLADAGVATELLRCDGMIHDFVRMFNLLQGGHTALEEVADFLRETLRSP